MYINELLRGRGSFMGDYPLENDNDETQLDEAGSILKTTGDVRASTTAREQNIDPSGGRNSSRAGGTNTASSSRAGGTNTAGSSSRHPR